MNVGLFVPCYVEQFYPQVAIATLDLLEKYGCSVAVPGDQTCCGQPLANAGYERASRDLVAAFVDRFEGYDYVVTPSASCALHVVDHYPHFASQSAGEGPSVSGKTYELCQFLADVLEVDAVAAEFRHRVGLHYGCHGLRGLRLGAASELGPGSNEPGQDRVRRLLDMVEGVEVVPLQRNDECCGFGGTFSVSEEAVSVRMGEDRIADHLSAGAEIITSADMSCLMHLQGIARRQARPVRFVHVAEILNGSAR